MRKRKTGLAVAITVVVLGAALFAQAHTPTLTVDCDEITVDLVQYNGRGENTVTVTIDGDLIAEDTFGTTYHQSYPLAGDGHTYLIEVVAWNAPNNPAFSPTWEGETEPCTPESTTTTVEATTTTIAETTTTTAPEETTTTVAEGTTTIAAETTTTTIAVTTTDPGDPTTTEPCSKEDVPEPAHCLPFTGLEDDPSGTAGAAILIASLGGLALLLATNIRPDEIQES